MAPPLVSSAAVAALLACVLWALTWGRTKRRYPPGPEPAFLVGNVNDVPKGGHEWEAHAALAKKYGECVCQHGYERLLTHAQAPT